MSKQQKLFEELNDPPLLRAADRVIELRDEKRIVSEKLEVQERNLIGLMRKAKKEKIRHGGFIIQIRMLEAKNKISLKPIPNSGTTKSKNKKEQLLEDSPSKAGILPGNGQDVPMHVTDSNRTETTNKKGGTK